MGLLFNVAFACIYSTIMHWRYIWSNMRELTLFTAIGAHCIPIGFFAFGVIDLWTTYCNIMSMICIFGALFATGLFLYHSFILMKNQTTYEQANRIFDYDLKDWRLNLKATLGDRWPLTVFITPFIHSSLPGDGLYFPTKQSVNKLY